MAGIWHDLHFLFDTDDGSLPIVRVTNLGRDAVGKAYAFIRSRARAISGVAFWHTGLQREERLDAWPNAALLVVDGIAEQFHVLAAGLTFNDVVLPDIGVLVYPDKLTLDYRMGPEWDEARVTGLFDLLRQLVALDPNARVRLHAYTAPDVERTFLSAFAAYCQGLPC